MERCPHPNCGHIGTFISKTHCIISHQMVREELFHTYGHPKKVNRRNAFVMGKESRFARGTLY